MTIPKEIGILRIKSFRDLIQDSKAPKRTRLAWIAERAGSFWTFGILFIIVAVFFVVAPNFHSKAAWVATALAGTEILLLSIGEGFVMINGGIDLSVGANLGLSGMVSGWVMSKFMVVHSLREFEVVILGLLFAIAVGLSIGLINGLVVTRLKITPLIATLGMLGAATGVSQLINRGQEISQLPHEVFQIGISSVLFGWLPVPSLVGLILVGICGLLLHKTRFGQHCFAIGSSYEASERSGIKVERHTTKVYGLAGALAGVAGFLVMAQLGAASITSGQNDELAAITAVVIGGVSIFGGRGNIAAAVVGTLIITVLQSGLVIAGVNSSWQVITIGVVLVAAVFLDQQRIRLSRRT